jgi:hypothetical protein
MLVSLVLSGSAVNQAVHNAQQAAVAACSCCRNVLTLLLSCAVLLAS